MTGRARGRGVARGRGAPAGAPSAEPPRRPGSGAAPPQVRKYHHGDAFEGKFVSNAIGVMTWPNEIPLVCRF